MSVTNCFSGIIGITRKQDTCLEEMPPEYFESKSEIYIDELKGLNLRIIDDSKANKELFDLIDNSLLNAINVVKNDILQEVLKYNQHAQESYNGRIGSQKYTSNLTLSKTYSGVSMYCKDIKDGFFRLKKVGALFTTTGNITVYIYNNLVEEALYTVDIQSIANKYTETTLDAVIELPLSSDEIDNIEYSFVYTVSGLTPKNNQVTCGCAGKRWCFDRAKHCFDNSMTKERWRQYVMLGGFQTDDITLYNRDYYSVSNYMYGLTLTGDFGCYTEKLICSDDFPEDYWSQDQIGISIAYAIAYKTAEFLLQSILDSTDINRYTMLNREGIFDNMKYHNSRFVIQMDFIAKNIDIGTNGCLQCKPAFGYKKITTMI